MHTELILRLVGLRYKLLWAHTRTRNGRIVLFVVGYTLALLIVLLFAAGGFGAAQAAVRSGRAEFVAQAALSALFLQALLVSVVTGFGINTAFSDEALRRFAVSPRERLAARHLSGILEPVWLFALALFLGLSTGMFAFGPGNFWLGAVGGLLLLAADYLLARVLATLIEWLSRVRGGTMILLLMLIAACMLPGVGFSLFARHEGSRAAALGFLHYTPPFASAALMIAPAPARVAYGLGTLALWIAGLLVLLAALERVAARPRTRAAAAITWDNRYERAAAIFGPALGPLAARNLRYYLRSNKVRMNYVLALPLMIFITMGLGQHVTPDHYFVRALGGMSIVGFLGTAVMATNQFGFDASGFRRYFLLPVPPASIVRASSYTALALGGLLEAGGLVAWLVLAPPVSARVDLMLAGSAVAGLFLMNALALWTSLLAPRRTDFESTFGNQLSLWANVLLIGSVMVVIFGAQFLDSALPPAQIAAYWWLPSLAAVAAVAFYIFSLQLGGRMFNARREELLNIIEGRL